MNKRFVDREIFIKEWFFELNKEEKLFYIYVLLNCDSIGVFEYNRPLIKSILGIDLNLTQFLKNINGRIIQLKERRLFVPKFVEFQYGKFNNTRQFQGIYKKLYELGETFHEAKDLINGLYKDIAVPIITIKEKKKKLDTGDLNKPKQVFKKPTIKEISDYGKERNNEVDAKKFFNFYESKGWMVGKNKMKDWQAAVRTWEQNKKDNEKFEVKEQRTSEHLINFNDEAEKLL